MSRSSRFITCTTSWSACLLVSVACWGQGRLRLEPAEIFPVNPALDIRSFQPPGQPLQPAYPTTEEQLPADAAKIAEGSDADIAKIQDQADIEIAAIQRKADEAKRLRREKTIVALQELQDKYTREAKLDEAVAIRDRIRRLKLADIQVYRDPGSLYYLRDQVGKSFHFEVVGSESGSLWGTEVYTGDSSLAKAAVHSGVLKPGQKGIVKVTLLEGQEEYDGSTQYGVTSSSYAVYPFSFTVDPWRETPAKP